MNDGSISPARTKLYPYKRRLAARFACRDSRIIHPHLEASRRRSIVMPRIMAAPSIKSTCGNSGTPVPLTNTAAIGFPKTGNGRVTAIGFAVYVSLSGVIQCSNTDPFIPVAVNVTVSPGKNLSTVLDVVQCGVVDWSWSSCAGAVQHICP